MVAYSPRSRVDVVFIPAVVENVAPRQRFTSKSNNARPDIRPPRLAAPPDYSPLEGESQKPSRSPDTCPEPAVPEPLSCLC